MPVQNRAATPSVVTSGTVPKPLPASSSPASEEDPWLHSDYWEAYRETQAQSGPPAKSTPPARFLAGPTESRFQEQEARIHAIEQGLADLRSCSEKRHQEVVSAREEDARANAATAAELRGQLTSLSADFATQLRTSVEALQGAQSQQLQQVMSSFEEVKHLQGPGPQQTYSYRRWEWGPSCSEAGWRAAARQAGCWP